MDLLAKIITALLYPVLLVVRCLHTLMGADPLKLKEDTGASSCWIARDVAATRASYFSEASELEGRSRGGIGRGVVAIFLALARLFAPSRVSVEGEKFKPAVDREQGIPDEVYTLW